MESSNEIVNLLYLGILAFVALAALVGVIFLLYSRKVTEQRRKFEHDVFRATAEAEEKQKEKIARNLHDDVIPTLSAILQSCEFNTKDFEEGNFDLTRAKKDVEELSRIIKDVREVSQDLIPGSIRSRGLHKALENHINLVKGIFEDENDPNNRIIFSLINQTHIFRICLEILNNLKKHSDYKVLKCSVKYAVEEMEILISHDGRPIRTEEILKLTRHSTGIGLKSVQSRAFILNAKINYGKDGNRSFVRINIPKSN